jgi:PiT family inorganic phosphate transporter
MDSLVLAGIALAFLLNLVNGANDAAQSVATVIATRAIRPGRAIILAACGNFIGPFLFPAAVAATFGTGIVATPYLTPLVVVTALITVFVIVLTATRRGLPISSSQALVGALVGSAFASGGISAVILPSQSLLITVLTAVVSGALLGACILALTIWLLGEDVRLGALAGALLGTSVAATGLILTGVLPGGVLAVVLFVVVSPVLGFTAAFLFDIAISHIFRHSRQDRMRRVFSPLQVAAGTLQAVSHGANDAQHAMGIITALLITAGTLQEFSVPGWVVFCSAGTLALGTCFGGWKVIAQVAKGITKIRPYQGFAASVSGGLVLSGAIVKGIPVSSSHVLTSAIVGVGATRGVRAVRWEVVHEMVIAWVTTIPFSAILALLLFYLLNGGISLLS